MTTAPPAQKPLQPMRSQRKFEYERTTSGGITLLKLSGTLDQTFEGQKVAAAVKTKKLIVDARNIRRFASWGMSEWMDFLRINAQRDFYLVECSTYALSQLNLVTGLLGHAKLVSFYASYRCASCGEERESLFLIPRDRAAIRDLPNSHQDCTTCGGRARLEEYPAAFFGMIAGRPAFDIDDEVLSYLRTQLKYPLTPDLSRFRAFRRVHGGNAYLRVSGSLATLPSETLAAASQGTTIVDLEGVIFDDHAQVEEWRAYMRSALPKLKSLQLLNCPLGFVENAIAPDDLRDKLKIRSFALAFECLNCESVTPYMVDVAENLEQLVAGTAPAARCPTCNSALIAAVTPGQIALMRSLPARDRDAALDKFLAAARRERPEKLENCLVALPEPAAARSGSRRALFIALGLGVLILAGLVVVALGLWRQKSTPAPVAAVTPPPAPAFERPAWIMSDVPSSAYCHDMINRLMCVGVSSYRATRDEGAAEASDTALEELVISVGLKISDPFFRESVINGYSNVRSKALSALQAAEQDYASPAYATANAAVNKARKRVVDLLQISGGAAVPTQRSDWYWEEYAAKKGGTEVLVFVRYDVTLDAVKALVEKYSASTQVLGSTAITAFPALAWQHADFAGGAMLTKVGHSLAEQRVVRQSVISAVGEPRVTDAVGFSRRVEEWKQQGQGELKLTVKTGDAAPRVVEIKRARLRAL